MLAKPMGLNELSIFMLFYKTLQYTDTEVSFTTEYYAVCVEGFT
jgi:hypothetical protein